MSSHIFPAANKVHGALMWMTLVGTADPMHAHRPKQSHIHKDCCWLAGSFNKPCQGLSTASHIQVVQQRSLVLLAGDMF